MRKLVFAGIAFVLTIPISYAQGQVNFNNKVAASGINARVLDIVGAGATSPPWAAGLAVDGGGILTYIPGSATSFRGGAATGYIQPVIVTVPGHDIGSSVTLRMFAYHGPATDLGAAAALFFGAPFGMMNPVTVTLGGGTFLPPDMVGLQGICFCPEPSAIALGLLGAAGLLGRRRK